MAEVLIAGVTGGREHALGQALSNGGENRIEFSHGNPGTAEVGVNLGLGSVAEIVDYASRVEPDLVVVGPEAPLVDGIADQLRPKGIRVFGPGAEGARLESSKAWAVNFMRQYGIRHPESVVAQNLSEALEYADTHDPSEYVIKADGLCGGKGVLLPDDWQEAQDVIHGMMSGVLFGEAGKIAVLASRRKGPEISAFLVADGKQTKLVGLAQDHKRLKDNDEGPNTGGMGAYSPVPFTTPELIDDIMEIGDRTVYGLQDRGVDYRGVIYLGLMLDEELDDKPTMIEYNVRFGDPETQPLVSRWQKAGVDVYNLLHAAAVGSLERDTSDDSVYDIEFSALTVCLAAGGYPVSPRKGDIIHGVGPDITYENVLVHHGGTQIKDGRLVTSGGRVLYVTGVGDNIDEAAAHAYAAIGEDGIYFADMQYRTDIGHQARS